MQNKSVWTKLTIALLGLWLIATSFSFSGQGEAMMINDLTLGVLLIGIALLSMRWDCICTKWTLALLGTWLQAAPLIFWAPSGLTYLNDTLVGALVIALAVIIPKDAQEESVAGGGVPPGWSYNPSAWPQRVPIIFLGFFAWMFARYMANYQLGYLDSVVDPVFGDGTLKVITSSVSKAFPVADAGLGAMAYTLEVLMGAHGGTRRWHTIPWFVVLFAILVVPLGFTSIVLIMLQPILVGYWCFWCLLTALCMLFMIALALDEVVAVLSFLRNSADRKKAFWKGADAPGATEDLRSSPIDTIEGIKSMLFGISFPWTLFASAFIGLYLMFSPKTLELSKAISDLNHVYGALIIAISVISMAEVARALRYLNCAIALFAIITGFFIPGWPLLIQVGAGVLLILFTLPKGPIHERYGRWDSAIF